MKKYPGVYQDNDTYYYKLTATTLDGAKKSTTGRGYHSEKIAYEAKLIKKNEINNTTSYALKNNTSQFIGFIDEYFDRLKSNELKNSSIEQTKYLFKKHFIPFFKDHSIQDLDVSLIQKFKNKIMSNNTKISTKNTWLSAFRLFFEHLHFFEYISSEQLKYIQLILARIKEERAVSGSKGLYTFNEFKIFQVNLLSDKHKLLAQILFTTGCRLGESLALQVEDIDFDKSIISFSKTRIRVIGSDKNPIQQGLKSQKERKVSITKSTLDMIKKHIESNSLKKDHYLFYTKNDKTRPITKLSINITFGKAAERAKLTKIRVHDLRHSHICYLLDNGVDPKAVANRAGHKDVSMTLNVYNHLTSKKIDKLNDVLNGLD